MFNLNLLHKVLIEFRSEYPEYPTFPNSQLFYFSYDLKKKKHYQFLIKLIAIKIPVLNCIKCILEEPRKFNLHKTK